MLSRLFRRKTKSSMISPLHILSCGYPSSGHRLYFGSPSYIQLPKGACFTLFLNSIFSLLGMQSLHLSVQLTLFTDQDPILSTIFLRCLPWWTPSSFLKIWPLSFLMLLIQISIIAHLISLITLLYQQCLLWARVYILYTLNTLIFSQPLG